MPAPRSKSHWMGLGWCFYHLLTSICIYTLRFASGLPGLWLKISAITPVLFFYSQWLAFSWKWSEQVMSCWKAFRCGERGRPPSHHLLVFLGLTYSADSLWNDTMVPLAGHTGDQRLDLLWSTLWPWRTRATAQPGSKQGSKNERTS